MAAIISGKVFNDLNKNGVLDVGEPGISGVTLYLYSTNSASCVEAQTDVNGNYSFTVLTAGSYTIYETVTNINASCPPTNFTQPDGFTMSNGPRKQTISITQAQINNNATVSGNNFSHLILNNRVACTDSFIQFARNPSNWYNINLVTGDSVFKTNLNPSNYVNAIGYNPLDGYIYGYNITTNSIARIDDAGNIITLKPNPPGLPQIGFNTGTFDQNGFLYLFINDGTRFYVVDLRPNSPAFMKLVNPTTGYTEQTSNFGVALNPASNISDWVYNKTDGNLYGVSNTGVLVKVVPTSGVTTNLPTTGAVSGASYGAQAIDANGNIYAINNQTGNVYKYVITGNTATATLFSNTVITSNNDGTICPGTVIEVDFGDAPDNGLGNGPGNYNTLIENNGPRHQIINELRLGALITGETNAYQNSDATGDDLTLGIQDDALTVPLAPINSMIGNYTLPVTVTNETGVSANLYGWIDLNQNGLFEENEFAFAVVPSTGVQTINLNFNVPAGSLPVQTNTFVRLRLTTDNLTNTGVTTQDERSVGPASNGEVEDYILTVSTAADVSITKTAFPNPAVPGSELTFTLTITNNGPDGAQNVTVTDVPPIELNDVMFSVDNGVTYNPWTGSYVLGNLASGEVRNILVKGVVEQSVTTAIVNTANVSSTTFDPDLTNNTDTVDVPVLASADLSVVKTGSPNPVLTGDLLTYTILVANAGPSSASNVSLNDALPDVLENGEYSLDDGATWNPWGNTINLGDLNAGALVRVLIRGQVSSAATSPIVNTAVVSSTTPDPDPTNNTSTEETEVQTLADLSIVKNASSQIVNSGDVLTYTITVTNNGPSDAANAVLEDDLPSSLLNGEYSLDGITFLPWSGIVNLGNIISGASLNVLIRGEVASGATGSIINTGTVSSDTPDPDLSNNTDTVIVGINSLADLAVTKTGNPSVVEQGDALNYTITVTNNGPSDASDVLVSDDLPASVTNAEYSLDAGVTWNPWVSPLNLGTMINGEVRVILIRGVVNVGNEDVILNTTTVSSVTPDPDLSNNTDSETTGVNFLADVMVSKTATSTTVTAGDLVTYNIVVTNNGPDAANDVLLADNFSTDLISPEYSLDGGATWNPWVGTLNLGTLQALASVNVLIRAILNPGTLLNTLNNTVTVTSTTPDPDPSNNIDEEVVDVDFSADLMITKTAQQLTVSPGDVLVYSLEITNNGPSLARNASLIDAIPLTLLNQEFSLDGGITWMPWVNPYNLGNVDALTTIKVLIRGTVSNGATGLITNTSSVTSQTPDPNLSNNTDTENVLVVSSADISVVKTALNNPVKVGDVVTYSLFVNNAGPSVANDVLVYDLMASEVLNPEYSLDNGVTWNPFTIPFSIGDLDHGEAINVLVRGTIDKTNKISLTNNVFVVSTTPDPDNNNNFDNEELFILPGQADLSIVKTAPSEVTFGESINYNLTVTNLGPGLSENVTINDPLSDFLSDARFSLDNGLTWQAWNGTYFVGNLPAGEEFSLLIRAIVNKKSGTINNTALVTSTTPDPDPTNNSSNTNSKITTVVCPPQPCPPKPCVPRPCKKKKS